MARGSARWACLPTRLARWPKRPDSRASASSTSTTASMRSTKCARSRSAAFDHLEAPLGEDPGARASNVAIVIGGQHGARFGALALLEPLLKSDATGTSAFRLVDLEHHQRCRLHHPFRFSAQSFERGDDRLAPDDLRATRNPCRVVRPRLREGGDVAT